MTRCLAAPPPPFLKNITQATFLIKKKQQHKICISIYVPGVDISKFKICHRQQNSASHLEK